jgi:hypothetical protein
MQETVQSTPVSAPVAAGADVQGSGASKAKDIPK